MRPIPIIAVLVVLAILMAGCSGNKSPVVPVDSTSVSTSATFSTSGFSNRWLWGIGEIAISSDHGSVDVLPLRLAEMHLNAVGFLEKTPCTTCFKVSNLVVHEPGLITIDLTLIHPFPGNPRLTGFDVRAVLMTGADYTFPESGRWIARGDDFPRLLLPNGYTTLFNPWEFDQTKPGPPALKYIPGKFAPGGVLESTLNPYVAFRREAPRRMFESGGSETRTIWLHIPTGPLRFGYAVDACWVHVDQVIDPLVDFPPEANCPEAYDMDVQIGSGLEPIQGSAQPIEVAVFDHQGLDTISSVLMEAPDLFDGAVKLDYLEDIGPDKYLFPGSLTNEKGAPTGEYPLLIRVIDTAKDANLGQVDAWFMYTVQVGSTKGWVRIWGGPAYKLGSPDAGRSVAVDKNGDIYVSGYFLQTVDFDPGDGVDEHTAHAFGDAFLSKFNSAGNFSWARTWGGNTPDSAGEIHIDNSGNLLVESTAGAGVDLDPGPGVDICENGGALCRYDPDGNYLGHIALGFGVYYDLDSIGNIYLAGELYETQDLDPGPGVDTHVANGVQDACLLKLDPSGTYLWGRSWGGPGNSFNDDDNAESVAIDSKGNVFVTGRISKAADYDPGPGVSEHEGGKFLSIFDTNGNFLGVSVGDMNPSRVFIDGSDNMYGIGTLNNAVVADLDPGPGVDEHTGPCCWLAKYSLDGAYQWGRSWGFGLVDINSLTIALSGDLYLTGSFEWNLVDFDPGPGDDFFTSAGMIDGFLTKYLPTGEYQWTRIWGSAGDEAGYDIAADSDGNAYITGWFTNKVDFDPGLGVDYYTALGCGDAYLLMVPPDGNW